MSKFYFLIVLLGITFTACQTKEAKKELIFGQWTLKEGFRNNNDQPSKMMEGIYFNIEKPTGITTNFMGMEENGQFALNKAVLTIETAQKTKFDIKELTEHQLELETIIQGIPFRFVLEKK